MATNRTDLILDGLRFVFTQTINPDCDPSGAIIEFRPQERYLKRATSQLHAYGDGAFCRFRIDVPHGLSGVYAFVIDGGVQYIGRCEDFRQRFNTGYGNISPKNCYAGGQPTNCRINQLVLDAVRRGRTVDLFFHQTPDYSAVEARLIVRVAPPWNGGRRARPVTEL